MDLIGALTVVERPLRSGSFYSGKPRHDHVAHCLSGCDCVTHAAWHITGRIICPVDSLACRTGRRYFSLPNCSTKEVLEKVMKKSLPKLRLKKPAS
jgi:hypothetical protein